MYSAVDQQFMSEALAEAQKALYLANPNPRVGCVIVKDGQVIGRGFTQKVGSAHAEVQALANAKLLGNDPTGSTIYVTLEPCVMCAGAAYNTRIGRIVFGAFDAKRGFSLFQTNDKKLLHPKTEWIGGVMEDDCAAILRQFFENKRK